jgi:hypothetical protein
MALRGRIEAQLAAPLCSVGLQGNCNMPAQHRLLLAYYNKDWLWIGAKQMHRE